MQIIFGCYNNSKMTKKRFYSKLCSQNTFLLQALLETSMVLAIVLEVNKPYLCVPRFTTALLFDFRLFYQFKSFRNSILFHQTYFWGRSGIDSVNGFILACRVFNVLTRKSQYITFIWRQSISYGSVTLGVMFLCSPSTSQPDQRAVLSIIISR